MTPPQNRLPSEGPTNRPRKFRSHEWLTITDEEFVKLHIKVLQLEDELRREGNARGVFSRLLVSLNDITDHDHDTIVTLDDRERRLLAELIRREGDREPVERYLLRRSDQRRAWHETVWGRISIIGGMIVVALDIWRAVSGH